MKNWEYIIYWALILLSPTPKFRIHLSMTSSEAQKAAGYELSCRLFYAWWLSVRFFWLMRRQISIQNAFFVMIGLSCGALFWTVTKIKKMGWNRRRTRRNEKKTFTFYAMLFSFSPQLFGLLVLNCNWNKVFQRGSGSFPSPQKRHRKNQRKNRMVCALCSFKHLATPVGEACKLQL